MKAIKSILAGLLGSAFYVLFLGFAVLSLPFNIIALMRLEGWEWWSALLAAMFLACIPIIGQIGYVVLAIMGGYYFLAS
jgi:hypothetical protein